MKIVKLHCGNGHTKGNAKKYSYFICSLFETHMTKNGYYVWINSGVHTKTRRGEKICIEDGKELAKEYNALFSDDYGSLHNKKVKVEI